MKSFRMIALLSLIFFVSSTLADTHSHKKVLMVASNLLDMGDAEKHNAKNDLFEFAPPYHIFKMHGFDVDFVSPDGGAVHFYRDQLGIASYTIKYENFLDKTNNTLVPSEVNPDEYWGVFTGGGYGVVFDVARDQGIQKIIANIYEKGGVLGMSGHGAASIANVKLSNGEYLVAGKKVAGFPNSTEQSKPWAKQGTLLPFLVESQLNKHGAMAQNKQTLKNKHAVVVDKRIVSTMFLPPATLVAKQMIELYASANKKVVK